MNALVFSRTLNAKNGSSKWTKLRKSRGYFYYWSPVCARWRVGPQAAVLRIPKIAKRDKLKMNRLDPWMQLNKMPYHGFRE